MITYVRPAGEIIRLNSYIVNTNVMSSAARMNSDTSQD